MTKIIDHSIRLLTGYTDKSGKVHHYVTFGKRLTVGELIALDADPQSQNPTQAEDLVRRKMITAFGSLKMPVTLDALLDLDEVDRLDLEAAANEFLRLSRGETVPEFSTHDITRMMFGVELEGTVYKIAEFGNLITGRDLVEADKAGLTGVAREAYLIGRRIKKLESESGAEITGPIELSMLRSIDAEDFNLLRVGAALSRESFRLGRRELQEKRGGSEGVSSGSDDRVERGGDTGSSSGSS